VQGDYRIELPEVWDGQIGGWRWDGGEKGEIMSRHSPGGGMLGWLSQRLLGREEIVLDDEKGEIRMEMVAETPVVRVIEGPNMEKLVLHDDAIAEKAVSYGVDESLK